MILLYAVCVCRHINLNKYEFIWFQNKDIVSLVGLNCTVINSMCLMFSKFKLGILCCFDEVNRKPVVY